MTMLRLLSCCPASMARRLYWTLGLSIFLLIAAIISTHAPNDLRFLAGSSSSPQESQDTSIRLKTLQLTGSHLDSKVTHGVADNRTLPRPVSYSSSESPAGVRTKGTRWSTTHGNPRLLSGSLSDQAFGIYILLDNASLENGYAEAQWNSLNESISSTCRSVRRLCVRILVNRNDSKRTDILHFIHRFFNTCSVQCKKFETTTQFDTVAVDNVRKDARTLNKLMADDYVVERMTYFSVVLVLNINFRGLRDQWQLLVNRSSHEVGLVVDYAPNSAVLSSMFFSKIHFEIFGWFLRPLLADIQLAVTYTFHLYPANLITTLRNESANSSFDGLTQMEFSTVTPVGRWSLNLDRETLRRYLSVSGVSTCFRCLNMTSHKVISMSLYGNSSRYTMGAIRNAQLLPITFPGWRLWFYVERQVPNRTYAYGRVPQTVLAKLVELGAEIRLIDATGTGLAPMMWRFTVVKDPDVGVFIVRDCDSRLTPRDAVVVADWLRTDKAFHCVRDHPSHSQFPVSGGLWGARRKPFLAVFGEGKLMGAMRRYGAEYVQDMRFLEREVWPNVTHVAHCHDSFSCERYPASHPFPVARIGAEHLGQVYDEFSVGRKTDMDTVRRTPVNTKCVVTRKISVLPGRAPGLP